MADYVYRVAIQANLFQNNMADKTVWQINQGRINEYLLYHDARHPKAQPEDVGYWFQPPLFI